LQKGELYGEIELPEAAPWVFTGIGEERQKQTVRESKRREMEQGVHGYKDKGAQARYVRLISLFHIRLSKLT